MPTIHLITKINAPIERVFDLARSIDLHKISTGNSKEEAIKGKITGLIHKNETVTWKATHLGIRQTLTSVITAMERPYFFQDKMVKGAFKSMHHDHLFKQEADYTLMTDLFYFESPGSILGTFFNKLFLTQYLENLLIERNKIIKEFAEGENYQKILDTTIKK